MYLTPNLPLPAAPPSGTVTFLFTDIEGSTTLWEDQPEAMSAALARHDSLMKETIAARNGFVFRTVGDAFCAAFATAPDALAASLAVQILLHSEPGDLPTPLRVRMGLHTGAAEARDGDYYGQPLNRVSRLMAAGHGGQILLSVACQELARDTLPGSVTLRDLGPHRLKDLARPEQVFQVLHPDLPADFPPLKSLNNPDLPNNLPQQITSFIGRETEVAEIKALIEKHRMLTLTGAGGSGKTRLSLQAAADMLGSNSDGVWLAGMAPLSDPNMVPQTLADALGVREEPDRPLAGTLVSFLKTKHLLLVLDNCEHVLAACAFLVRDLLRVCPNVSILATSREALGVPGEQTYRVPSLSLPDPKQTYTAEALGQYEAVRLFIDRAGLSHPSFAVTSQNAPAVAQICARLDGIPLAIELAAARVKSLSAEQIGTRLDDRFRLLTGGSRTALPRQQTLKAAIDWSYDLLTKSEKALLRRLSVFAGGWTLEAAEAVCAAEAQIEIEIEIEDVLDLLAGLVDKSLAVYEEDEQGQGRYHLLETVRQYGRDRLAETGESDALRGRHQKFFLALAEEAEPMLSGRDQIIWLDCLELEHDNLRAALDWCLSSESLGGESVSNENAAVAGLRLTGALGSFWLVRGHLSKGRQWLDRTLERADRLADAERSKQPAVWMKALTLAGGLASSQGNVSAAQPLFERAAILARESGDRISLAYALRGLGWCRMSQKTDQDKAATQALFEESLLLFRQVQDPHGITFSLRNLGDLAFAHGNYASAKVYYAESLALARDAEDQHGIAGSLVSLGRAAFAQGDLSAAETLYAEALPLSRKLGDRGAVVGTLVSLGRAAYAQGNWSAAQAFYEESLPLSRQLEAASNSALTLACLGRVIARQGSPAAAWALQAESLRLRRHLENQSDIAESLEGFAELAHDQGRLAQAARLLGAAAALRETLGSLLDFSDQAEHDRRLASAREAFGEEMFAAAFAAGRAMPLDAAVDLALAGDSR